MTLKDLIPGKCYHLITSDGKYEQIATFKENSQPAYIDSRLSLPGCVEINRNNGWISNNYTWIIREATQRERLWLDTCVKAGQFIPLENIPNVLLYKLI